MAIRRQSADVATCAQNRHTHRYMQIPRKVLCWDLLLQLLLRGSYDCAVLASRAETVRVEGGELLLPLWAFITQMDWAPCIC